MRLYAEASFYFWSSSKKEVSHSDLWQLCSGRLLGYQPLCLRGLYGRSESGFGAVLVEQLARSGFGHCQCIFTGPVAQGLAPLRHPSTKGRERQWGSNGLRILGH